MSKKILVVDDEPVIVKYLRMRLTQKGYSVFVARDGETALAQVRAERPDLILLDLKLPRINGYEVFRRLKEDPEYAGIPIIFSTADATVRAQEQAERLEAADCILKPFEAAELYEKVERHTNG